LAKARQKVFSAIQCSDEKTGLCVLPARSITDSPLFPR